MMRRFICWATLLLMGGVAVRAEGQKLIDLIPGLYDGDGISLATAEAASHTAHFSISSVASINRLNQQVAAEVGGFPFSSSVGGFSFEFDPIIGDFVSTNQSLGPLMAERAQVQGKGSLNFNFSYTYLEYSEFSGLDLGRFAVVARHDPDIIGFPDLRDQFEQDILRINMDIDIQVQLLALSATYGFSDKLDLGFLIPYALVDMEVKSLARVVPGEGNTLFTEIHSFDQNLEAAQDRIKGQASGVGDLILRGKYHLVDSPTAHIAVAALVQLGTADAKDFLGTGDTALRPYLVLSRTLGHGITPHLNLGYEFNLDDRDQSALEYTIGFDIGTQRYAVAGEFISSHELGGDGIGDDIVDTALGVKFNPWRQLLVAYNARIPLNDAGLRSAFTSTFSVEYDF
jgi:hypothetical protein